ncbi:SMP-30/gluconolactonase/LRE family protein [Rhodohalobacter sulfatireducens]|uniref:SMP-30/gluconolactonase/LRE family protein n=1 Tax=Rhodohalobacter sulfatireducens TaxID=2911366 RepID=A0ABS9KDD9_9BACT|nr:SMP-30/gluconolactonase/LRE family protein [Rhodohalobacter sulfatireducens]MCG2588832.1 SMP-30/gluconolactonase/LRE family protein [Rhodohalobacter sulfatireducens]
MNYIKYIRHIIFSKILILSIITGIMLMACGEEEREAEEGIQTASGDVEVLDDAVNDLIDSEAVLTELGSGYAWSEGPVWVEEHGFLLFSDIPNNIIHKWTPGEGVTPYLEPAGYTGEEPRGGELGSNGLYLSLEGDLLLAQHGDRRIARMDAPLDEPGVNFTTIAGSYNGQRLNSPNDLVQHSNGDIYFTDPPYGLEEQADDPSKELDFQGVYRVTPEGEVILLTDELSRPNGIEFSPNEKTLYVANSSGENPIWMAYDVTEDGNIANGRVFHDASDFVGVDPGSQDGMDVDANGNIYATGPGGVWIFSPDGTVLGKIKTNKPTANCTIGQDGKTLFITASDQLLSIPLK